MDSVDPQARDSLQDSISAALQVAARANTGKTRRAKDSAFGHWKTWCNEQGFSCLLEHLDDQQDQICYILAYLYQYRHSGRRSKPVRSATLSKIATALGKGLSNLGRPNPCKPSPHSDKRDPLLTDFLAALEKEDAPASRAYPINTTILRGLFSSLDTEHVRYGTLNRHIQLLCVAAFYWLMRPTEYLYNKDPETRSEAFCLGDIHFTIRGRIYNAADPNCPLNDENHVYDIEAATLTFSDQKNAVRGEQVGHRSTTDPELCPCKALGRLALHLRKHGGSTDTPICSHYNATDDVWYDATPVHVTNALRHAANDVHNITGIDSSLVSARSLRPGGATALLCAGIDGDAIKLLGRWKSDAMLRYLRIQAQVVRHNFSQRMLENGDYTFHPQRLSSHDLPVQTPVAVTHLLAHDELYDSDYENPTI